MQHPPGSLLDGRFRIRSLVGEGGMGTVYEAEHVPSRERGALKLMQPKYVVYPLAVERFAREAVAASRIAHPHIVKVLDAGRLESGEPYLFMELLQGEPLSARIARHGRLALDEVLRLSQQAASALAAAHAAGVVHRDVKPENLFVLDGEPQRVKLLDFGISKFLGNDLSALTKQGLPMGTFRYMPPEQMAGAERVDERADVYSLAVVVYECLVGRPPFIASGLPALLVCMRSQRYARVRELRPELPDALDDVLATALSADPERRYPSIQEFALALSQAVGASPSREKAS